ncbi:hypothetical protein, partial [Streptomyces griseofuscus]|uniref:hypothetical protein n=1 Tax=Streptomyces griseofuscus TaxID=146922 RepID=UPI003402E34D
MAPPPPPWLREPRRAPPPWLPLTWRAGSGGRTFRFQQPGTTTRRTRARSAPGLPKARARGTP